jgi:S1-C subfamily serine protease
VVNTGYTTVNVDAGGLSIYEIVNDLNAVKEYLPQSQSNADGGWKGSGSGFFIDERGYMATNYHVVDGAKSIEVTFIRNGETESYPASVVLSDKQNDLSILKVESSSFKQLAPIPYNFSTRIKDTGSEVFTLGYPIADVMGEEVKFTDGKISSKTGIQGDVTVYQISVPIQPGNSGGPLFDNLGNIVGITSSRLNREYFKSENVNYAIKSSYLSSLVDALPQTIHLRTDAQIADKPLTEKIKLFQDYMIYIKVK